MCAVDDDDGNCGGEVVVVVVYEGVGMGWGGLKVR